MLSFKRMPRILELGFGLVRPCRLLTIALFSLALAVEFFSFTEAPVYKASFSGICLVLLQADTTERVTKSKQ
jgi:hypothetical protein